MNCSLGESLPIASGEFNTAAACATCGPNCDRCDPAGPIKCHKCSEG